MKATPYIYAASLKRALDTAPKQEKEILTRLASIIKKNHHAGYYPEIMAEYQKLQDKAEGIAEVQVTQAKNGKIDKEVKDLLSRLGYDKVKIASTIDESILGGVVIRLGDTLIDASVKGKLQRLNRALIK